MPPKPLMDLSLLDPETTVYDREAIRLRIPQRHDMEMLDRIILFDRENELMAGVKEVRDDEFWVSGHFPDRPVLPGVLMVETAGQLASFWFRECGTSDKVLAFAAADNVRFRGVVIPGDALVIDIPGDFPDSLRGPGSSGREPGAAGARRYLPR